jgi:hypothetical protein
MKKNRCTRRRAARRHRRLGARPGPDHPDHLVLAAPQPHHHQGHADGLGQGSRDGHPGPRQVPPAAEGRGQPPRHLRRRPRRPGRRVDIGARLHAGPFPDDQDGRVPLPRRQRGSHFGGLLSHLHEAHGQVRRAQGHRHARPDDPRPRPDLHDQAEGRLAVRHRQPEDPRRRRPGGRHHQGHRRRAVAQAGLRDLRDHEDRHRRRHPLPEGFRAGLQAGAPGQPHDRDPRRPLQRQLLAVA